MILTATQSGVWPRAVARRAFLGAALAATLSSGCESSNAWTLNYRLRVRVFANGQSRNASSVFRVIYRAVPPTALNQSQYFYTQSWGEAVPIDVGDGQWLFAMLGGVVGAGSDHYFAALGAHTIVSALMGEEFDHDAFVSGELYERARAIQGERDLDEGSWPMMVRFLDVSDLSSIRFLRVAGRTYQGAMEESFESFRSAYGTGAGVERVTVEITGASPSRRLGQILPWLATIQGADRGVTERARGVPLHENLSHQNFVLDGDSA